MKLRNFDRLGAACRRQGGAVLVMVAASLVALLGFAALVVDIGYVTRVQRALQASSDSAALAGGTELINGYAAADTLAQRYGAAGYNSVEGLSSTMVTTPKCLSSLTGLGVPCYGTPGYNALSVTQSVRVPLTFGAIFNQTSWTVSASSLASIGGGFNVKPLNVMLVLDTTGSMNNNDPACGKTRIACALEGVQTLLKLLKPTAANVGLIVYPPVASTTEGAKNYDCNGSTNPTISPYGNPDAVYSIIGTSNGLTNDFLASNTATSLSTSSNLNKAVGAGGGSCRPLVAIGGEGTYFADAIRIAQNTLSALPNRATSDEVIVLLSDGDASASISSLVRPWVSGKTYEPGDEVSVSSTYYRFKGSASAVANNLTQPGSGSNWQSYWSRLSGASATKASNQCAAAVSAAAQAKAAGTRIYSIGYSPSTSSSGSCTSDSPRISACRTMRSIASDASTFYSTTTNANCQSGSAMSLNTIFYSLAQTLNSSRLLPLNAQ
jgi:Flp pilus assembly protein TadG